jgi:hypothetical protein
VVQTICEIYPKSLHQCKKKALVENKGSLTKTNCLM